MNINPFKSKKEDNNTYKISIYIPNVDSMQLQMLISCKAFRDPEDKLLYLIDKDTKGKRFKELFPGEDKQMFSKEEVPLLEKKLKKLQEKKKQKKKSSIENYKNIDKEIYELEFLINKHKEEKGSFTFLDNNGVKCISYLRKSTGVHPLHYNIRTNNVFQPTETDSRDAFNYWIGKKKALEDKKDKAMKTLITIFGFFIAFLIIFGLGYGAFKLTTYNQRADQALIEQKYICQEVYEKGIIDIITTQKQAADIYKNKVENINITNKDIGYIDSISKGITTTLEILK